MKVLKTQKAPKFLAAGFLKDSNRVLFLCTADERGLLFELPCVVVFEGEEPVSALSAFFMNYLGIDAEIKDILFQSRYNSGSRKRKAWTPVLLFSVDAKKKNARVSAPYRSAKWVPLDEIRSIRLSRKSEWLKSSDFAT